jgi:hypothetical protein
MRAITAVRGEHQNRLFVFVSILNLPGHPTERWSIGFEGDAYRVSCIEDTRGKWFKFTTTCATIADALDIALVGVPNEEVER